MEDTNRLIQVLRFQLAEVGLTLGPQATPDDALVVLHGEQPLAFIQEGGDILYPADRPKDLSRRIGPIVSQVWEMEQAYQKAPPMNIHSVSDYRKLLQYNQHVLAARYDGDGQFTFVTWQLTYNQSAVTLGHYFSRNDYSQAKEDFLFRSGLVERTTSFQPDELAVIRTAILYWSMQDPEMGAEEHQDIERLLHRIDILLPLPDDPIPEEEADRER